MIHEHILLVNRERCIDRLSQDVGLVRELLNTGRAVKSGTDANASSVISTERSSDDAIILR